MYFSTSYWKSWTSIAISVGPFFFKLKLEAVTIQRHKSNFYRKKQGVGDMPRKWDMSLGQSLDHILDHFLYSKHQIWA